MRNFSEK